VSITHWSAGIKIVLALITVFVLFWFRLVDFSSLSSQSVPLGTFFVVMLIILLSVVLASLRWWIILGTQNIRISLRKTFDIVCIAGFTNMFLVGGIGGDAARIFYILPDSHGRRIAGVMSVVVDRALSLLGLISVGACIFIIRAGTVLALELSVASLFVVGGVLVVGFIGLFALPRLMAHLPTRPLTSGRMQLILNAIIVIARNHRDHPGIILLGWVLSVLLHALLLTAIVLIGTWSGIGHLDWSAYALAGLVAMFANVLPITPGGIGVGEIAFDYVCKVVSNDHVSPFATILLVFRGLTSVVSLYGAVVFVLYRHARQPAPLGDPK
jgi:uncharacterized membrane protein YbhN (UPF0104 family)